MIGAISAILALVFFVTAHEFGHFVAAKALGIKVTEFFFGFGPKLWSLKRGETEYGVKAIPLGGYVKVVGMNPLEEVNPADIGRTYREKPFWMKSVVVLAGVGMNFLIAYLILVGLFLNQGTADPSTEVAQVVQLVDGSQTPAALAGLEVGDRIVAIDGIQTPDWTDVSAALGGKPGQEVTIVIVRDGTEITKTARLVEHTDSETGAVRGFLGVAPSYIQRPLGLWEALGISGRYLGTIVTKVFGSLGQFVNPETLRSLFGVFLGNTDIPIEIRPVSPIGIGNIGSQVDQLGIVNFIALLASVNVMLGTLNVLPLYPLDGGHFAVALYEKITGRHANLRYLVPVAAVVIVLVGFLGLVGLILDIFNPIDI